MKINRLIIFSIILFAIILATYHQLFQTFYQQDEWIALGHIMTQTFPKYFEQFSKTALLGGGGRPLSVPLQYFLFSNFPFQAAPFVVFALVFHFLNSLLVFLLAKKITRNFLIASISAIFFATSSVSHQAVSWIGASPTTLPSAFFALFSILLYFHFLENEKRKFFYLSLFFALISFFFKESGIFIFILLPLIYRIYKKVSFYNSLKKHFVIIIYLCVAVLSRVYDLFFVNTGLTTTFVTRNSNTVERIILHSFVYPFESLSQVFIFPSIMWKFSHFFLSVVFPFVLHSPSGVLATETMGAEVISIALSSIILILIFLVYRNDKKNRKIILFTLLFFFLSFLPYVFLERGNAYLDSRYFYLGVVPASIIFSLLVNSIKNRLSKNYFFPIALLIIIFFYSQIKFINNELGYQVNLARERKNFLMSLKKLYPAVPTNSVFYITGNRDFYVPDHKIPFQQGMGYTLMVWYYKTGIIPKEFMNSFLWDIKEEGYREKENKGFGYYWNLGHLSTDLKRNEINKNRVIALFYDADKEKLVDITKSVREELK
ncbi:MAG: hypothetical protein Q7R31_02870 [Candidatus Levybacteria bacterium]|nr:hypothetical protein [Candidatus Levybacteria bacterium]